MSAQFLAIKQKYVSTFPQKVQELKQNWDTRDLFALRALLHKLAGSSGSYGFDDINVLCHRLMELLEVEDDSKDDQVDIYIKEITGLLDNPE